ncbi:isocitrate dehydrogenase (NAD(+)) idh1 [Lobulomyces angularis]|nr:isocitrate dehydrogenase (NAD(+)) idh1 [Lobulomyces angularis]
MNQISFLKQFRRSISTTLPTTSVAGTVYGGKTTVTLIPGDGVGVEMANSVKAIFDAANVPVEFEQFNLSGHTEKNELLSKQCLDSVRRNKVALKGILYTPLSRPGRVSWNVAMRKELDIYASVALLKSSSGKYPTRHN